jgi:hypothetical protein
MGKSGSGSSDTTQTAEPWGPSEDLLKGTLGDTLGTYLSGQFDIPSYPGIRVAPQSGMTQASNWGIYNTASQGNPITPVAQQAFGDIASGNNIYRDLDTVKANALGDIMPAAMSRFSGAGMLDSTLAADAAGRAATQAIAPIEYGAWDAAQNRRVNALGMAPQLASNSYLDSSMMGQAGAGLDQYNQRVLDSAIGNYYEEANRPYDNIQRAVSLGLGLGGMGGTQTTDQNTGNGTMETIGGIMQVAGPLIAMAAMSDRRVKADVKRIGETKEGYPKYEFRYNWDEPGTKRVGVMADEVPPEITLDGPGGFKMVDYGRIDL